MLAGHGRPFGHDARMHLRLRWLPVLGLTPVGLALVAGPVQAAVTPPHLLSAHLVLQRDRPGLVWGTADLGEEARLTLRGHEVQAMASTSGAWRVDPLAMLACGPHELVVRGCNTISSEDVPIGEVWLCPGQSNMEMGTASFRTGRRRQLRPASQVRSSHKWGGTSRYPARARLSHPILTQRPRRG